MIRLYIAFLAVTFLAVTFLAVSILVSPVVFGQAFDCVELNDDNTNIFDTPDDCFNLPANALWCTCVRSIFTHPVKGEVSGFNQALQWIVDQPGIGNHRVEVFTGTLDLSGLKVGDVIGGTEIDELIPQSVGVPPGTFFVMTSEIRVTEVGEGFVDFDVIVNEVSPAGILILNYDPTDAAHSDGLFYRGRLSSSGPGQGFVLEYRYPRENVQSDPEMFPAVEADDAADPGFTARFRMKFFSKESGIYTLPQSDRILVATTLRQFTEDSLDEILPLGAEDLCQEIAMADACKEIEEDLALKNSIDENSPPLAVITMVASDTVELIEDPALVSTRCGSARIIFRGGNSDDGDGGLQGLSHEWFIFDGPEGGATIPEETRTFTDTEITFSLVGEYEIGLRVDDGQAENNTDEAFVVVEVDDSLDVNVAPMAIVLTTPDPAVVELEAGQATVELDASSSANGFLDLDDCMQELSFAWSLIEEPREEAASIADPEAVVTMATFNWPGVYIIGLEVDDQQEVNHRDQVEVTITITGDIPQPLFRRGDTDASGVVDISDPIFNLTFQFIGLDIEPPCRDALDTNDDGMIDVSDPISNLTFQFLGGFVIPAPGSASCGPDPTDDALTCEGYPEATCI